VHLDFATRELSVKVVYYGPALSGKTTNLRALHAIVEPAHRGRLMNLETRDDRTLFFDLLPLSFRAGDLSLRLKVFTVPGQAVHTSTRRLVLQGVDGVVFVADSQRCESENNGSSFIDLKQNMKQNGVEIGSVPVVIQFNKRDLPDVITDSELKELAQRGREPVFLAVAAEGDGVVETFLGSLDLTLRRIDSAHGINQKFGVDHRDVLERVAARLGYSAGAECALGTRLGPAGDSFDEGPS
jgi:mutual gliding-motility protein MglA